MTVVFGGTQPSEVVMLLREGALALLETGATTKLREVEKRINALESENAALREFVAAADALADFEAEHPAGLWPITVIAELDARQQAFVQARQRLATEFGIELPGAEAER